MSFATTQTMWRKTKLYRSVSSALQTNQQPHLLPISLSRCHVMWPPVQTGGSTYTHTVHLPQLKETVKEAGIQCSGILRCICFIARPSWWVCAYTGEMFEGRTHRSHARPTDCQSIPARTRWVHNIYNKIIVYLSTISSNLEAIYCDKKKKLYIPFFATRWHRSFTWPTFVFFVNPYVLA